MARRTDTTPAAKDLRQEMTPTEERLRQALRGRNAEGLKIRRQRPIGLDVVDCAVPAARRCIGRDGGIQDDQTEADAARAGHAATALAVPCSGWDAEDARAVGRDLGGVVRIGRPEPSEIRDSW